MNICPDENVLQSNEERKRDAMQSLGFPSHKEVDDLLWRDDLIKDWIDSHENNEVLGRRGSPCECPVANYLYHSLQYHYQIERIIVCQDDIKIHGINNLFFEYKVPLRMALFICFVDCFFPSQVTTQLCQKARIFSLTEQKSKIAMEFKENWINVH